MFLAPSCPHTFPELFLKGNRGGHRLTLLIKHDGLANVVHHHLTRTAPGHVPLKLLAKSGVDVAIDIVVQKSQEFFALHKKAATLLSTEPQPGGKLQPFSPEAILPMTNTAVPPCPHPLHPNPKWF